MESVFVILFFHPACHKACYHGISGSYAVYQCSLRCRFLKYLTVFCYQDSAFTGHGDQHVSGSFFLEFLSVRDHILTGLKFDAEDFSQFMVVRFHKERMIPTPICLTS